MTFAFISHPDCLLHEMGEGHPESPARLMAINDQLIASGLDACLRHYDAPLATREQLLNVHDAKYVDQIFQNAPEEGRVWLDPDTSMNPHSLQAALRAAGAVVFSVDLLMNGEASSAFCSVRPPGHHATRANAMGFCIFNNVAVGVAYALSKYKLQRVAIVDFDVHHGNGTEDIFHDESRVLICSTFQHPFYPFSGAETDSDHMVNIPLPASTNGPDIKEAIKHNVLPVLDAFQPELIFFSAGFDAHVEDDMAQLNLTEHDYAWITRQVKEIADKYSSGRMISVLEGGYALSALGRSVMMHIKAMLGE